ncbi:hypothetical protein THIARS_70828 [Thiomonas delicata]|uniref:Uncharacterized protein n=1 Tax=Thiomonas delicata TaxID=364030 RepID=A0A238D792_THIDL|nr:hypothetical protein THIARS_70828 [Thiomonas delicata]
MNAEANPESNPGVALPVPVFDARD